MKFQDYESEFVNSSEIISDYHLYLLLYFGEKECAFSGS